MFEDIEMALDSTSLSSSSISFEDENIRIALAWENITFTIPGIKGEEDRQILSNISGHIEPGQVYG